MCMVGHTSTLDEISTIDGIATGIRVLIISVIIYFML